MRPASAPIPRSVVPTRAGSRVTPLPVEVEVNWRTTDSGEFANHDQPVPFSVLLGLMGRADYGPLPSHAGQTMPRTFHAPVVRPPDAVTRARTQRGRPTSVPASTSSAPEASMMARAPAGNAYHELQSPTTAPGRRPLQRRGAGPARSVPLQTLDRTLQKELAQGRLGFPGGHFPPPPSRLPAGFMTALTRDRGKSAKGVSMIPANLRAWESQVERQLGSSGGASRLATQAPLARPRSNFQSEEEPLRARAPGGAAVPPEAELTPYEMRRFLHQSQRYFLSVRKEPFAMPSHGFDGRPMSAKERAQRSTPAQPTPARLGML